MRNSLFLALVSWSTVPVVVNLMLPGRRHDMEPVATPMLAVPRGRSRHVHRIDTALFTNCWLTASVVILVGPAGPVLVTSTRPVAAWVRAARPGAEPPVPMTD
jgi:hypothetical protein